MPGNPKEWRAHALRCEELARAARTPDARQHFSYLAQSWNRLAADLEGTEAFLDALEGLEPERTNILPLRRSG
jgi:hypothetical protein